jgi:hypothetical protein
MSYLAPFNTLAAAKKLIASGMPQKQAEAIVEAWADILRNLEKDKYIPKKQNNYFHHQPKKMKNNLIGYVALMLLSWLIILVVMIKF